MHDLAQSRNFMTTNQKQKRTTEQYKEKISKKKKLNQKISKSFIKI